DDGRVDRHHHERDRDDGEDDAAPDLRRFLRGLGGGRLFVSGRFLGGHGFGRRLAAIEGEAGECSERDAPLVYASGFRPTPGDAIAGDAPHGNRTGNGKRGHFRPAGRTGGERATVRHALRAARRGRAGGRGQ